MAAPVFQNSSGREYTVPTLNGSGVIVPINKYVRGSYYYIYSTEFLTEIIDPSEIVEHDIVYTYPETSGGINTGSGISEIVAGDGLTGGGTTGVITLDVAAITADMITDGTITATKIADNEVVKSINNLHDTIFLSAGSGITVTPSSQTLTISSTSTGLTLVTPTAPLTLALSNSNQTLSGSIAITAANSGGAVALQSSSPGTQQTGHINVSGNIIADGIISGKVATSAGIFTVGTYQVENYSYSIFSANAANGIISFQLPELTVSFPSGVIFTFVKTDATTHTVAINSSSGQLISGVTQKIISAQWGTFRMASITSENENYWVVI